MSTTIFVKPGHEAPVKRRHPWLFSGAVDRIETDDDDSSPDAIACCREAGGRFLAWGTACPGGRIVFRALSFAEDVVPDAEWIADRITKAVRRRTPLVPRATNAVRLVNAEGDGLPGLTIDRFAGVLVCQITTAGMLAFADAIAGVLNTELSPQAIVVRTPRKPAQEEGMPQGARVLAGELGDDPIEFTERGVRFTVDPLRGQKTGFYLDQRDNRQLVRKLAEGRRVLDAYCYTGGFGVYAALGGAASVLAVDRSEPAAETARAHFALNGIPDERFRVRCDDVSKVLRDDAGGPFDLIVLDPPPLAPGRGAAQSASRMIKDINFRAIKRLAPGGLLLTFSCSQGIDAAYLSKIVFGAALDAHASVRVLGRVGQPFDHVVSVYHPEGEYLTGLLLQVD